MVPSPLETWMAASSALSGPPFSPAGLNVPDAALLAMQAWVDQLEGERLVLNYHPEAPPHPASRTGGFYYADRTVDDEWIIRQPVRDMPTGN